MYRILHQFLCRFTAHISFTLKTSSIGLTLNGTRRVYLFLAFLGKRTIYKDFLRTDAAPQNNRRPVFFDILQLQCTILVRRQMQHLVHALNLHHGISCRPMSNLAVTGVTGFVKL